MDQCTGKSSPEMGLFCEGCGYGPSITMIKNDQFQNVSPTSENKSVKMLQNSMATLRHLHG